MPTFPNRCQHIKVNGTQCGSPALRRNRFCYFHKRHHEERVALRIDRAQNDCRKNVRSGRKAAIDLPVLEDANSIQVSLMQIMRLLVAGQIDPKTAGLLLYALQTASINLPQTRFEPNRYDVILDPSTVGDTMLGESIWEDSDFEEDNEGDEEDEDNEQEGNEKDEAREAPVKAKKANAQPTGEEIRAQLRAQILQGFPSQILERAARETSP